MNARPAHVPSVSAPLFVPTLHGIRGLAVLLVVLYHAGGADKWIPNGSVARAFYEAAGPYALDALCFTTGFVLFLPVVNNGSLGSTAAFAIRRFARMGPPYYVCMALVLVLFGFLSNPAIAASADRGLGDLLIHAAFLQRELSPANQGLVVNSPVWSLSIDFAFYLLFPLIAGAYLRRPLIGLAVAVVISLAWRMAFIPPDAHGSQEMLDLLVQPPLFLADFASGMTAAWAFLRLRERGWSPTHTPAAIGTTFGAAAAILALAYLGGSSLPYHLAVFQDPAAVRILMPLALLVFTVAVSLGPRWLQSPLTNRPLVWFAEISYSVYLYHFPVIFFGFYTVGIARDGGIPWLWTPVILVPSIALGLVSYLLVERPSRAYGRRLARRLTGRGPLESSPTASARARALGRPDG